VSAAPQWDEADLVALQSDLLRFARIQTGNAETAEDLAQETLLAALRFGWAPVALFLVGPAVVVAAFFLLCSITYTLYIFGPQITRLLGKNAMNVVTRMMGLILAGIGTQMLVSGLKGAFPVLN